jgi:hypothetical protein
MALARVLFVAAVVSLLAAINGFLSRRTPSFRSPGSTPKSLIYSALLVGPWVFPEMI